MWWCHIWILFLDATVKQLWGNKLKLNSGVAEVMLVSKAAGVKGVLSLWPIVIEVWKFSWTWPYYLEKTKQKAKQACNVARSVFYNLLSTQTWTSEALAMLFHASIILMLYCYALQVGATLEDNSETCCLFSRSSYLILLHLFWSHFVSAANLYPSWMPDFHGLNSCIWRTASLNIHSTISYTLHSSTLDTILLHSGSPF